MRFRSDDRLTHSQSQAFHANRTSSDGTQDAGELFNTETSMWYMTGEQEQEQGELCLSIAESV